MPSPESEFIVVTDAPAVTVGLELGLNAFNSLAILNMAGRLSGMDPWVAETLAAMTPEQRARHRLVFIGLHFAVLPDRSWPTFRDYLAHLAGQNPIALRDRLVNRLVGAISERAACDENAAALPDSLRLLNDRQLYLDYLRRYFQGPDLDLDLEAEAHDLMNAPPAMKALIVEHLRQLWELFLAAEMARVEPMLRESAQAFKQVDYGGLSRLDAVQRITGRALDEDKWAQWLAGFQQVICVPSAHVGPYVGKIAGETTLWIFFGARLPEGAAVFSPDLSRSELLVRLSALADDTRLRIMALLAAEGELCAQTIIVRLDLSQSAASRHLRQLTATGYLVERRQEGGKCYRLNPERIESTLAALSHFLAAR